MAQILCQFKASLVTAEITDPAVVIIIAEYEVIVWPAIDDVKNPVILIASQMRFLRPFFPSRKLFFIEIAVCISNNHMKKFIVVQPVFVQAETFLR